MATTAPPRHDEAEAVDLPADGQEGAQSTDRRLTRRVFVAAGGATVGAALASGAAGANPLRKARVARTLTKTVTASPAAVDTTSSLRLVDHEVVELVAMLQSGEISSVELTEAYFERVNQFNGPFETYADNGLYNAFVRIDEEGAYESARAADKRLAEARAGGAAAPYLCGIPMGVKDSVGVKGFSTQDGTPATAGNTALHDATIVANLRARGVVPMGLTICSEFSGSTTGTFAGNAWNPIYIPGGSSQGSGCAAAGRLAAACVGEETGGSIIFPSSINGCSGIKPSLGTVSIAGLMPLNPGYDVLGPIARSGRDAAMILNAMIGLDPVNDPQTLSAPIPFPALPIAPTISRQPLAGLTIGIPQTDWMTVEGSSTVENGSPQSHYSPQHLAAFEKLRADLESLGAEVIEFPGLNMNETTGEDPANPYYASPAVLAEVLGEKISPSTALIDANRYEFNYSHGPEAFIASGVPTEASIKILVKNYGVKLPGASESTLAAASELYAAIPTQARVEGEKRRRRLVANYTAALEEHDVDFMLIMQVGTVVEPRVNSEGKAGSYGGASRRYYQVNNAIGWPTVSFPIGFSTEAPPKNTGPDEPVLPISAQFWGKRFSEPELVQAMIDYQAHFPEANSAIPPDPTPTVTSKLIPKAVTDKAESEPLHSNDNLVEEARIRAEAG